MLIFSMGYETSKTTLSICSVKWSNNFRKVYSNNRTYKKYGLDVFDVSYLIETDFSGKNQTISNQPIIASKRKVYLTIAIRANM